MEIYEIQERMQIALSQWSELTERQQRPLRLTHGAEEALTQMIINIEKDPSPYWAEVDLDSIQRFALAIVPNVLADMNQRYGRYRRPKSEVSSWEIWHDISSALDKWCPVPKDI